MSQERKRVFVIAEMMQRKLSQIIQQEIRDPRLPKLITISGVDVSNDLSHAKIYFTVFEGDVALVTTILNNAASYLRTALARTSTLRTVPQLHFVFDASLDYGRRLTDLINKANHSQASDDSE
jgi:ribosome-binding factor A